jgi:hypothetical protein
MERGYYPRGSYPRGCYPRAERRGDHTPPLEPAGAPADKSTMTKPLILVGMLLLTVVALACGALAYSSMTSGQQAHDKELRACIDRAIFRSDITNPAEYCMAQVN